MLETSARLLRLLTLLHARREWSGHDLAVRLEVTPRTVRRDVGKLRALGYPVNAVPGASGGYRLGAGSHLPPLLLADDEAVAVVLALRTSTLGAASDIGESSLQALIKLEQVLPTRLRHRVSALAETVVVIGSVASTVNAATLSTLGAACRDLLGVRFRYRDHNGMESARNAEPYRLVATGRRWYLLAFDTDRQDWRTFRVDRMVLLTPGGPSFAARQLPDRDIAGWTHDGVTQRAYRYTGRFTIHAAAHEVADLVSSAQGVLEPLTDHTCSFVTGSDTLSALAVHVAGIGFELDVHEPPELIEHLAQVGARLTASVQRSAAVRRGSTAATSPAPTSPAGAAG